MCSLALNRSESRLESLRISKFSTSPWTSSELEAAESVDLGEHESWGLDEAGGVGELGIEAN